MAAWPGVSDPCVLAAASMGNKTERIPPTIIAMLVCIVTIVINVYMFQLQVYVYVAHG